MKKFDKIKSVALVAFALAANVAVAQNLKVTSHGEPLENNAVIDLPYVMTDYSQPGVIDYFNYKWDPHLEAAVAAGSEQVTVTVTSLEDTAGFQLCWPNGCQQVNAGKSASSSGVVGTQPVDLQIHKEENFMSATERPTVGGKVKVTVETETEEFVVTINCLLSDGNGVGENIAAEEAPEYFTLQGIRVAEPQKGQLLIVRQGGKVSKRIF